MANKTLIVLGLALIISVSASARKIAGQIVDNMGNTLEVTFNIPFKFLAFEPNFERMQYRVVYYNDANEKIVLRPDEAREFVFNHNNQRIRMVSRVNAIEGGSMAYNSAHIFLRLRIDGRLKLFNHYVTQHNPGMYNPTTGMTMGGGTYTFSNYVLQLGEQPLLQPRGMRFRKDMISYLRDCPEVVSLIESRELRKGDLEIIVLRYNQKCSDTETR